MHTSDSILSYAVQRSCVQYKNKQWVNVGGMPPRLEGRKFKNGHPTAGERSIYLCFCEATRCRMSVFKFQRLLAELSPERLVLGVSVRTLDAEVELDLRLCT